MSLYALPDAGSEVVAIAPSSNLLHIIARSQDFTWLRAQTEEGITGWVPASQVNTNSCLDSIPAPHAEDGYQPQAPISLDLQAYPNLIGLCARSREIFQRGQQLGNRAEVFSKIGDSITISPHFLGPIGYGEYHLDHYLHLQEVIDYYSNVNARVGNSFTNPSLSAFGGWSSWTVVNYHASNPSLCLAGEVPLECELRLVKPAVALIMLGTNDVVDPDLITPKFYEENMRKIIETCIQKGVIPILSTIPAMLLPDFTEREPVFNAIIVRLTDEYDIPLWDYHTALEGLPNSGLIFDGVHPSVAPGGAGDFSNAGLQFGMNMRNLTALQVLDGIWRGVIR